MLIIFFFTRFMENMEKEVNNPVKIISYLWRELLSNDRLIYLHLEKLNSEAMRLMQECERLESEFDRLVATSEYWNNEYERLNKIWALKGENEAIKDQNLRIRYIKLRAVGRITLAEIRRFKKDKNRLFADRDRLTLARKRFRSSRGGMRLFLFGR